MEKNEHKVKSLPFISIITVVFNAADTLEQTIQSVLSQSYPGKEYIIIDGGSTDGSLEIIKKYNQHLAWWISEPDSGLYAAMNKGLEKTRGDLIGILNAGDWYEPDIFSVIASHYQKVGDDYVIHGMMRNFQNEEFYSITGNSIRRLRYDMIQHPTCFIPKKMYLSFGNYMEIYKFSADYDLILRYTKSGVLFSFIEVIITNFRLGGISSIPAAEKEMYRVRMNHGIISKSEGYLRIMMVSISTILKKILK
jgi:glycosyltransferase involved in cell wall biosynthesis